MKMKVISFKPSYIKKDGKIVINLEDIPFPKDFKPKEQGYAYIPARAIGGNHKHPRTEAFFTFSNLIFYWQDENGKIRQKSMAPDKEGNLKLFIVPPFLPHAVINDSSYEATIIEFADKKQEGVEQAKII